MQAKPFRLPSILTGDHFTLLLLVTTSKALVTRSDALVPSSVALVSNGLWLAQSAEIDGYRCALLQEICSSWRSVGGGVVLAPA